MAKLRADQDLRVPKDTAPNSEWPIWPESLAVEAPQAKRGARARASEQHTFPSRTAKRRNANLELRSSGTFPNQRSRGIRPPARRPRFDSTRLERGQADSNELNSPTDLRRDSCARQHSGYRRHAKQPTDSKHKRIRVLRAPLDYYKALPYSPKERLKGRNPAASSWCDSFISRRAELSLAEMLRG